VGEVALPAKAGLDTSTRTRRGQKYGLVEPRREPLTDEDLALLGAEVREVIEGGDPPTRKGSCNRWSTRSGSSAVRRSTRLSLCQRFDHWHKQYRYGDSNPGFWHEKPAS
jgi:hypothetical protein